MKQLDLFKTLLLVAFLSAAGFVNAQTSHPVHYGLLGTSTTSNWYQDYVGVRFEVLSPISVAGDKQYSFAYDGGSSWGAPVTTPIVNVPIVMPAGGDSLVAASLPAGSMNGKIALCYRGGGIYFSDKAARCYAAGAIAVVIVNNNPNGVIGMSASTTFTGCPVFMITKADGDAIDAKYHSGVAGDTARMTITLWGQGNTYDVGFIPQGIARWHDYAVPYHQLTSGLHPMAYMAQNGAFIGNFGTGNPGHVKLFSTTSFATVGAPTVIHNDTTILNSFPAIDSIWAFYGPQHNLTGITSGSGKVTVKYTIHSDSADQYMGDDTTSYSFYTTDSLYSKGRYDFANKHPLANMYEAAALVTTPVPSGDLYIWGPMYYIAQGGGNFCNVQWSMSSNTDTGHIIASLASINVYVFKWVDGVGGTADSFVENGELVLLGAGVKSFAGSTNPGDTSGGFFNVTVGDSLGNPMNVHVDSNNWYLVAPEVPNGWFLGCDGYLNTYPRTYGRNMFNNYLEYPSAIWPGGRLTGSNPQVGFPSSALAPCNFGGYYTVDSVYFSSQKGLIPSVAFTTTNYTPDTASHVGVHGGTKSFSKFDLYPNPASEVINASLSFENNAGTVTYTIIDATARVITKETHNNVMLSDNFTYATGKMTPGNYFLVAVSNGRQMFKKFTVIR